MADKDEHPLVSVVTLNWNGKRFLKDLFDSLGSCSYPNYEVIMVDNCSTDDSVDYVKSAYPFVKIVQNDKNYLYARGNNEGLKVAKGKYICLLNNDVDVDPGFIEPIVAAFEENPRMGAGQPKILAMQRRDHLEYAGACGGFLDTLGYPFLRGRLFFSTEADNGQYDQPLELFWASGACIFLRKATLDEVGLLDEDFILHMEEIDLCWRTRLFDWKIYCIPQSRIWHHVGGTLDQDNPRKTYWNFRNNIFLLLKNLAWYNVLLRLPIRLPMDALAALLELFKGHFANAFAVLKAYGWVIAHLGLILKKRRQVQRSRKVSDGKVFSRVYRGSIVFEYFILQKRKFSELLFVRKLL